MLTCKELFEVEKHPKISDISLKLLSEYYKTYLNPFVYKIEIIDKNLKTSKTIELRFDEENFCHLLGIHKIVERTVSRKDIHMYKGQTGWDNVINQIITFNSLNERTRKKQFKSRKEKYVFFYLMPKILEHPKGIFYDQTAVSTGNTKIDCEILFYNDLEDAYVHIGIKQDGKLGYFIPKTFFVEKVNENKNGRKYVENQQEFTVLKINKEKLEIL